MQKLQEDTLVVFLSDTHIGGDPGCDGFESPGELGALFEELAAQTKPVELILAGDLFDFLQIGEVPKGMDRAALTIARPEYVDLFVALQRFREEEGKRVIYLPGNHDAESFWNPEIQKTLRERGLVDEFAYYYLASIKVDGERRVIYCEHGNQLDPANTIEDYHDRLDTPLGHHVVMDFTRRVAPIGVVSGGLDLSEIKMVYPLVAIPRWISSRYFQQGGYVPAPTAARGVRRLSAACLLSDRYPRRSCDDPRQLPGAAAGSRAVPRHRHLRARDPAHLRGFFPRDPTRDP